MDDLLDKRLLFVTGKGGVGKSTVAAALGLVAARRGQRTLVVEVARQDRVSRTFGRAGAGIEEIELADGLFHVSIDPQEALEEYLHVQVKLGPMADLLASSRMFQYFSAATPGMRELLTMGKIWELAQLERRRRGAARYDLVVVDGPASGHGAGMLRTPRTFADIARVGPIAHQGRRIHATIVDPRETAVVAVALPEEMPVSETIELARVLREELGVGLSALIVNALSPPPFTPREAARIDAALADATTDLERGALEVARSATIRARRQQSYVAQLRDALGVDPIALPFALTSRDGDERALLERLADELEPALTARERELVA